MDDDINKLRLHLADLRKRADAGRESHPDPSEVETLKRAAEQVAGGGCPTTWDEIDAALDRVAALIDAAAQDLQAPLVEAWAILSVVEKQIAALTDASPAHRS